MARRKTNDLENQMSLMDMMASENPEYTEEGPEELLDPGEDMGDSEGQTDDAGTGESYCSGSGTDARFRETIYRGAACGS